MKKSVIVTLVFLILTTVVSASTLIAASSESMLYFAVGRHYFNEGDYSSSIEFFEKSIEKDVNFAQGYHNLAVAYYESGNNEKAIENFNAAIAIDPSYAKAYYSLGLLYFEQNDFNNAVLNFESAASIEGSQIQHFDLAQAYVARFRQKEDLGQINHEDLDDLKIAISRFEMAGSAPNADSNKEIVMQILSGYEA